MAIRTALGAGRGRLIGQLLAESLPLGIAGGGLGLLLEGGRGTRLRSALVAGEIAIALVLTIGAVLMIRTFRSLTAVNPGFNTANLLTALVDLPRTPRYTDPRMALNFHREAVERIRAQAGVRAVSVTNSLPLGGNYFRGDFQVQGRDYSNPRDVPILDLRIVDRNYLDVMQIPLVRGRFFDQRDHRTAPLDVVVNQAATRRLFGTADPIGQRIGSPGEWYTVIGLIADIRHTDAGQEPSAEVLLPFEQRPATTIAFTVRLDPAAYADPARFAPLLRGAVESVDRTVAVHHILSMERIMADRLAPRWEFTACWLIRWSAARRRFASAWRWGPSAGTWCA